MLIKLAFRNLLKHKSKSLVVGAILALGSLIMMVGNATLTGMDSHVSRSIADHFLGDVVVMASNQDAKTAVFQAMGVSPEILPQYSDIRHLLENSPLSDKVKGYLPFTIAFLIILTENSNPLGYPAGIFCIGADLKRYYDYFDNLDMVEGNPLTEGERGVLINHYMRDFYYQFNGDLYYPLNFPYLTNHLPEVLQTADRREINDHLIVMGISSKNSTIDLRVPVKGVVHFKTMRTFWREICLLDIDSFREAMNYNTTENTVVLDAEEEQSLLGDLSADELFTEDLFAETTGFSEFETAGFSPSIFKSDPAKGTKQASEVYQLIAVNLHKDQNPFTAKKQVQDFVTEINSIFAQRNIPAKAVDWKVASGMVGNFVDIIRMVLFLVVMVIFFVAIIIIMNTLAMSVLERAKELGMMRAIGARRSIIGKMLFAETFTLSAVFGGMGIAMGVVIVVVLASLNLTSSNEFAQLIFGGNTYRPKIDALTLVLGGGQLFAVTLLSVLYPMFTAKKISPIDAVSRD